MIQNTWKDAETGSLRIIAENQEWDADTLKELREKHNIIFMTSGSGICPIMIIPREINSPLIAIGSEDDGCITFEKHYGQFMNSMDIYWIDSLIADLKEAKEFAKTSKKKSK